VVEEANRENEERQGPGEGPATGEEGREVAASMTPEPLIAAPLTGPTAPVGGVQTIRAGLYATDSAFTRHSHRWRDLAIAAGTVVVLAVLVVWGGCYDWAGIGFENRIRHAPNLARLKYLEDQIEKRPKQEQARYRTVVRFRKLRLKMGELGEPKGEEWTDTFNTVLEGLRKPFPGLEADDASLLVDTALDDVRAGLSTGRMESEQLKQFVKLSDALDEFAKEYAYEDNRRADIERLRREVILTQMQSVPDHFVWLCRLDDATVKHDPKLSALRHAAKAGRQKLLDAAIGLLRGPGAGEKSTVGITKQLKKLKPYPGISVADILDGLQPTDCFVPAEVQSLFSFTKATRHDTPLVVMGLASSATDRWRDDPHVCEHLKREFVKYAAQRRSAISPVTPSRKKEYEEALCWYNNSLGQLQKRAGELDLARGFADFDQRLQRALEKGKEEIAQLRETVDHVFATAPQKLDALEAALKRVEQVREDAKKLEGNQGEGRAIHLECRLLKEVWQHLVRWDIIDKEKPRDGNAQQKCLMAAQKGLCDFIKADIDRHGFPQKNGRYDDGYWGWEDWWWKFPDGSALFGVRLLLDDNCKYEAEQMPGETPIQKLECSAMDPNVCGYDASSARVSCMLKQLLCTCCQKMRADESGQGPDRSQLKGKDAWAQLILDAVKKTPTPASLAYVQELNSLWKQGVITGERRGK